MKSLATKGLVGLATSSAVAGGIGIAIKFSSSKKELKSIRTLIKKHSPSQRLLFREDKGAADGSSSEWKRVWKQYRTDFQNSSNNPFKLTLAKVSDIQDEAAPENFMTSCSSLFEEKVEGIKSDKYQVVEKYCTRLTSVSDLISDSGKRVLPKGNDGQSQEWKELWKRYRKDNEDKKSEGGIWKLSDSSWNENENLVEAPSKFREKCESESQVKTGDINHHSFTNVLNYCSVPI
ncbi:hypothetical protein MHC_01660 [Mycoplasma haemocanis str. Illinois]|uniref:Uncharacterized protein n=1 Tax=Mycoplasma haemocanis (strain Illinois) TaxID=1111676 RepID=H6N6C6_MYCHN|nr:hypothetical protein [Mycoplasma haemocanis]AEW45198.1 hypothetical protein MHC_01660 [Mycoplasma haemocanis str. Illinois]